MSFSSLVVSVKSSKGVALSLNFFFSLCAAMSSGCFARAASILASLRRERPDVCGEGDDEGGLDGEGGAEVECEVRGYSERK